MAQDLVVECTKKDNYIIIKATGKWTASSGKVIIDFARKEAVKHAIKRILFDLKDFSIPENEMIRYSGGRYIAEVLRPPFRVAAVGGRPQMVNHFAETVAVNRGAIFQAFIEDEPAVAWLTEKAGNSV